MSSEISPQFIASLTNALTYWQRQTQNLDDTGIIEIDPERHNLHQVVVWGLDLRQTWELAAGVALQAFSLAERRGYWQEWLEVLNRALFKCPATAYRLQGQLLNRVGDLHRYSHQLEEAIEAHKQAEALAQQQGDKLALGEAHNRLCWDYLETREYMEAEQHSLSALETFTHLGVKDDLLTNTYWALGSTARRRGNITLALERLTYAATLGRTNQQPTYLARILNELAVTLQEAASYEEALACLTEALKVLEATASERDKVEVQLNMGVLLFRQQQWAKAEIAFLQAISSSYLLRSGEIPLQALLANNLGNVLLKQGRLVEAETQLQYAWQLWLETQDYLSRANTMGSLAELYAKQGKVTTAVSLFKQAIQLLKLYPDDAFAQERLLPQFKQQLQALMN
jgi:tetratricopeptide (TPR) repeat protein